MPLPDEKPLEGWKEIAHHLGRSERTVQRWERKGLPARRHEALGVIAYPSELEAWVRRSKEPDLNADPGKELLNNQAASGAVAPAPSARPYATKIKEFGWVTAVAMCGTALAAAVLADAYGLAITLLWMGAVLALARPGSTPLRRVLVAGYLIAAMAYTSTASTMPEFQATVINSMMLPPSAVFLFVLGLKFIPLFVLVLGYSVAFLCGWLRSEWKKAYTVLGIVFLAVEFIFLGLTSGDDRVWRADLPGRWTLILGSSAILALNIAVWLAARRYLQSESSSSLRPLCLICGAAYLGVAVAAFFVDHEHNRINRYYLDVRWPETYVAANPDAVRKFQTAWPEDLKRRIGPDLNALLSDPGFLEALYHGRFYKQHSDEPFQLFHRAVIYSYRPAPSSLAGPSSFAAIRFPQELADALGFKPIRDP